jgi:hypothetical protein
MSTFCYHGTGSNRGPQIDHLLSTHLSFQCPLYKQKSASLCRLRSIIPLSAVNPLLAGLFLSPKNPGHIVACGSTRHCVPFRAGDHQHWRTQSGGEGNCKASEKSLGIMVNEVIPAPTPWSPDTYFSCWGPSMGPWIPQDGTLPSNVLSQVDV